MGFQQKYGMKFIDILDRTGMLSILRKDVAELDEKYVKIGYATELDLCELKKKVKDESFLMQLARSGGSSDDV